MEREEEHAFAPRLREALREERERRRLSGSAATRNADLFVADVAREVVDDVLDDRIRRERVRFLAIERRERTRARRDRADRGDRVRVCFGFGAVETRAALRGGVEDREPVRIRADDPRNDAREIGRRHLGHPSDREREKRLDAVALDLSAHRDRHVAQLRRDGSLVRAASVARNEIGTDDLETRRIELLHLDRDQRRLHVGIDRRPRSVASLARRNRTRRREFDRDQEIDLARKRDAHGDRHPIAGARRHIGPRGTYERRELVRDRHLARPGNDDDVDHRSIRRRRSRVARARFPSQSPSCRAAVRGRDRDS